MKTLIMMPTTHPGTPHTHFAVIWKAGVIWMVALLLVAVTWTCLQVMRGLSYAGLVILSGLLLFTGDWSLAKQAFPFRFRSPANAIAESAVV